jgi:hypothetical protein
MLLRHRRSRQLDPALPSTIRRPADVVNGWGRPRATSATEMWSNSPQRLDRLTRRLARCCSRFDVESQQSDLQLMLHGGDTEKVA